MVCLSGERIVEAIIRDTIGLALKKNSSIQLTPSTPVSSVFEIVENEFRYAPNTVELVIQNSTGAIVILNQHPNKTLGEIGVTFDQGIRNTVIINALRSAKNMTLVVNDAPDDDLILGASASPTTGETPSSSTDPQLSLEYTCTLNDYNKQTTHDGCNYVGLVNQAMTCYLNSLLQALYMTPEFRNALYNWEFDGNKEEKSIPYQLQRLFLNLQTSSKSAVETTELTRSFGWDMSEAWQQHDIQELCRVMFDALEQKFKDTQQANFINDLYEGKMLDYVKCLECGTEKSREDTFLDVPLPVRPFGSTVAYNSVEEALRAFVQPETLDGNNQYLCEKCNKKCDAHKGFKFIKFPYLLTLHLKRFDFDYSTMHRIKLNDKVVFPEILNLNSFVNITDNCAVEHEGIEERETVVKCDDCSTTDSGSALDDESCQFNDVTSSIIGHDDNCQDDDEGIDVSLGNHQQENEKNHQQEPKGPYKYELFSIMIHSGSASGGHYYAYIKDFQKNQWFCFNDQIVSKITEDDIHKTYGGGPSRVYYSGAYSTSTNAYMLMYRQIDKERNCAYMTVEEFPPHIKCLLQEMRQKEEHERALKERESDMYKLIVHYWHPQQNQLIDKKIFVTSDMSLKEATKMAHQRYQLEGIVNLEDCRLVTYNKVQDCIGCSFEASDLRFCDIAHMVNMYTDWLFQVKQSGTEFQVYKLGGVNMKLFFVNLLSEEVEGPYSFHVNLGDKVIDVKNQIVKMFNMDSSLMKLVQESCSFLQYLDDDEALLQFDSNCHLYKLYVSDAIDEDPNKPFSLSRLSKIIDYFVHVVMIEVILPDTDSNTLESLSIPPLDMNQNLDKNDLGSGDRLRISPQPVSDIVSVGFGDQSNSEDSSLSESDRTLVGDAPGDSAALLSSSSNSPADQHMASPSDPTEDSYNPEVFGNPGEEMNWDDDTTDMLQRLPNYYFRIVNRSHNYADFDSSSYCTIHVDKRTTFAKFKKNLEPIVGVPMEYFKIYKQTPCEVEWTKLNETLHWAKDGDKLLVKLGRVAKADEYPCKVFHLTPENSELSTFLFEWVIAKGQTVGQLKKEILLAAKKRYALDIAFNKSRLRAKDWKVPGKVYLNDQKFGEDITIGSNWEIYLQDLGKGEKVTNINQLCLFVKRWCPSTLTLTPFHEVVLNTKTVDELKCKLSEESDIPKEFIEVAALKGTFPCDMNILDIQDELEWNPNGSLLEGWPLQGCTDGKIFLYRDSREKVKEITPEEKKEINLRENIRLGKRAPKATYANRKERALKIYLDSSPKKSEDSCGD